MYWLTANEHALRLKAYKIVNRKTDLNFLIFGEIVVLSVGTSFMTKAQVIEYNMVASGNSQVVVDFTASAADAPGSLTVNFKGWTGGVAGAVNTAQTITTTGCQALTGTTNVLPATSTLTATGATSIITVSAVNTTSSGQSYCFN